jgi:hypothetical protein
MILRRVNSEEPEWGMRWYDCQSWSEIASVIRYDICAFAMRKLASANITLVNSEARLDVCRLMTFA